MLPGGEMDTRYDKDAVGGGWGSNPVWDQGTDAWHRPPEGAADWAAGWASPKAPGDPQIGWASPKVPDNSSMAGWSL